MDELAKIMPTLSEEEQEECVGGAHFYSPSGTYLGKVGESDEILIVDGCYYNSTNPNEELLLEKSRPFSSMSAGSREQVIEDIIERFDKSGSGAIASISDNPKQAGWYDGIGIYLNSDSYFYSNVADVLIAIAHKMSHRNNPILNSDSAYETAQKEYNAYWASKNSPYYSQASDEARRIIENQILHQWDLMKKNKP